jgi:hypothetical protein
MDYYKELDLKPDCTLDDIKTNYKKLVFKYHPDMSEGSADKFIKIKEAYDVISKKHKSIEEGFYFLFDNVYLQKDGSVVVSFSYKNVFKLKDVSTLLGGEFYLNIDSLEAAIVIERSILVESAYLIKIKVYPIKGFPDTSYTDYLQLPDRRSSYEILKALF